MQFEPPLVPAKLIKRYKRFLADVVLENGESITVHCPNTGSMKNCWEPGWKVWLQDSNNPKRKYRYTWVLAQNEQNEWIGINTHFANSLVEEAIREQKVSQLVNITALKREQRYGEENSRIDLFCQSAQVDYWVEVKSVTLKESDGIGYFPDAVSERGLKHLRELMVLPRVQNNKLQQPVLIFCVQHSGITEVKAAAHIHPEYANLMQQARDNDVWVIALAVEISEKSIVISHEISVK